jgi:transcriptional regulator with XRE-family HTH domain
VAPLIDPAKLGARIRDRRLGLRLPVREAAKEAGVSPATFSRVERGQHTPDGENLLKLAAWARVRLDELQPPGGRRGKRVHPNEAASTPEAVAMHLRADRKLKPEDAAVLADIFRSAYESLRRQRDD